MPCTISEPYHALSEAYYAHPPLDPRTLPPLVPRRDAAVQEVWLTRCAMLRAVSRGFLQALCYCHDGGVLHGSLGVGSVLLGTFEDTAWKEQVWGGATRG